MKHVLFTWTAGLTKLKTFFRVLEPCCYCDFKKMEALKGSKFGRAYLTGIAEDQDMRSLILDSVQVCRSPMRRGENDFYQIEKMLSDRKCSSKDGSTHPVKHVVDISGQGSVNYLG